MGQDAAGLDEVNMVWPHPRGLKESASPTDYHYQTLRCNVDMLKIIQLGLTFSDEAGNLPPGVCTWQLNFQFSLRFASGAAVNVSQLRGDSADARARATSLW